MIVSGHTRHPKKRMQRGALTKALKLTLKFKLREKFKALKRNSACGTEIQKHTRSA